MIAMKSRLNATRMRFLSDPVSFLLESGVVGKVIVISNGDDMYSTESSVDNQNLFFDDLEKMFEKIEGQIPRRVLVTDRNFSYTVENTWLFRFFHYQRLNDIYKAFYKLLDFHGIRVQTQRDLINILKDSKKLRRVKNCYRILQKLFKIPGRNIVNTTSLIMLHGSIHFNSMSSKIECIKQWQLPTNFYRNMRQFWKNNKKLSLNRISASYAIYERHRKNSKRNSWGINTHNSTSKMATLLMGDVDMNILTLNDLRNHFGVDLDRVDFVLARHDWNTNLLNGIRDNSRPLYWIFSSGIVNTYAHPASGVIREIKKHPRKNRVLLCNQRNQIRITSNISW